MLKCCIFFKKINKNTTQKLFKRTNKKHNFNIYNDVYLKKKKKKTPGDIITLHNCAKNHNHMMYGCWDTEWERQKFLSFWVIFCPFTLLTTWKIKILIKWKKYLRMSSFYTCVPEIWIMMYPSSDCGVPQTGFFAPSGHFLLFYPTSNPENQYFEKMKKTPVDIILLHMCTIYEDHNYDVCFLRYETRKKEFFIVWGHFLPIYTPSLATLKIKIWKNWKKTSGDMIILQMCAINHNHMKKA